MGWSGIRQVGNEGVINEMQKVLYPTDLHYYGPRWRING